MQPAIFLDRDGTIIEEKNYISRPEQVSILPGATHALKNLQSASFKLFIVSNQSGIGRGYFNLEDAEKVNEHIRQEFARKGVQFEKIYIAPEAPDVPSRGRKPSPQFLFDARDEFDIDLSQSFMIGDKMIDLQCGWNAGVKKSILVRTGYGAQVEHESASRLDAALIVDNLSAAATWIIANQSLITNH
jgi:D,D-heptose 1,7-bisphosphate phosphatase